MGIGDLNAVEYPSFPFPVELLDTPALLVDEIILRRNVEQMAELCRSHHAIVRPHAKSHKSRALVKMQLDAGAIGITVAKLDEAWGLSGDGTCQDVFLAYPTTSEAKAQRAMNLARDIRLTLAVDTVVGADALNRAARSVDRTAQVLIEIDSGLNRCGIKPTDTADFVRQLNRMDRLNIEGVFTHAGHAYAANSPEDLRQIAEQEVRCALIAASALSRTGADVRTISVGSTPTVLTNIESLSEVSELRPGNYVFKDRMQVTLGVASIDECALSVLTRVVSTATGNAVIDAGAKTLGLDKGAHGNDVLTGYGVDLESGWIVDRLSEEHGILTDGSARFKAGELLRLIPNHACMVTNQATTMYAVEGSMVTGTYEVDVRGGGR